MRTKTIVATSAASLDEAIGDYTEKYAKRDPDELHFMFGNSDRQYMVLLVWRSASRSALHYSLMRGGQ